MLAVFSTTQSLSANEQIWSVTRTHDALQSEQILLLDIRSRDEWKQTGLARGAWPVSMHENSFGEQLGEIISSNKNRTIALICATGGRSNSVLKQLQRMGITNFVDVPEGMKGSRAGPGWIKAGLPIVSLAEAEKSMLQARQPVREKD